MNSNTYNIICSSTQLDLHLRGSYTRGWMFRLVAQPFSCGAGNSFVSVTAVQCCYKRNLHLLLKEESRWPLVHFYCSISLRFIFFFYFAIHLCICVDYMASIYTHGLRTLFQSRSCSLQKWKGVGWHQRPLLEHAKQQNRLTNYG